MGANLAGKIPSLSSVLRNDMKFGTAAPFSRLSLMFLSKSLGITVVVKNDYEAT